MKTLDEVINYCEGKQTCGEWVGIADALQYLKWYKELADNSEAFAEWCENPPLTWDELNQMEGKPVWIEGSFITEGPHWIIVGPSHLYDGKIVGYGKTWQAYRKEKE